MKPEKFIDEIIIQLTNLRGRLFKMSHLYTFQKVAHAAAPALDEIIAKYIEIIKKSQSRTLT